MSEKMATAKLLDCCCGCGGVGVFGKELDDQCFSTDELLPGLEVG